MKQFCEAEGCEAPGYREVKVSEKKYGDSKRTYCYPCSEAYTVGVQHGDKRNNKIRNALEAVVDSYEDTGCESCGTIDEKVYEQARKALGYK